MAVEKVEPAAGVEQIDLVLVMEDESLLDDVVSANVEHAVGTAVFQQPPVTTVSPPSTNCRGT